LALVTESYPQLRRYAPEFLEVFEFRSTPASEELLKAVTLLRELNRRNARRVPEEASTGFVRQRWEKHVFTKDGIERRFYETCVLSELGKALRAGDLSVAGSRRYKDFEEYLLPEKVYGAMKSSGLPLAVELDCGTYLQHRIGFTGHWGDGTTSSSDGQRFRTGGHGDAYGQVNARYGNDPGVTFYTHVSDQYAPFYTKLINSTVRDATYVLDGLLYHESELQIEEHYTDTAGFTDHVFALCHLLGFRFAPRLRHLGETRLFSVAKPSTYPALEKLIGGTVNTKQINAHWEEILRLAASIQQGTVTASLMLRKLGAYPRQNALAIALRELGKLERTLFLLEYIRDVELRRRIHIGLNKGEARNALAKKRCSSTG
jgi:TnpA family transposase